MAVADVVETTPPLAKQSIDSDPWLTTRQAAERAHACTATIRHAIAAGALRARRLGNVWRIRASAVDAWLNADPPQDLSPAALERQLARARALSDRGRKAAAARWAKAKQVPA